MFRYGTETNDALKKKIRVFATLVIFAFFCLSLGVNRLSAESHVK